jgi:manganese/zinc/iron transport system permease protein
MKEFGFVAFFTDPVLRAPTLGCMLMCLAASLVGVIVFLRKQSLLGESLSHASYPGVILGVIAAGLLGIGESREVALTSFIMGGAFLTALLGLWVIQKMEKRLHVQSDAALCFVLSSFFGIGLTLASQVQFSFTSLYRQVQVYLYGQAATMTDANVWIYALLSCAVVICLVLFYKELLAMTFDHTYAKTLGIPTQFVNTLLFLLVVLAVVIGIRSVGVVLMSAMLIAPAVAARQYTQKLSLMLLLAAFFGLASGFLGNYLSVKGAYALMRADPQTRMSLPTGPMIVLVASSICLVSLCLAPERGFLWRVLRKICFRYRCLAENLLKSIWRAGPETPIPFERLKIDQGAHPLYLRFILWRLAQNGWIEKVGRSQVKLTTEGEAWAAKIVRLHRLWEVYLADYLGVGVERVHRSAEEMEHILTPELERELTLLLRDPQQDPHQQPIPPLES